MRVEWSELRFGPINLWVMPPYGGEGDQGTKKPVSKRFASRVDVAKVIESIIRQR